MNMFYPVEEMMELLPGDMSVLFLSFMIFVIMLLRQSCP